MKSDILKKNEIYKVFNDITLKNEIIIFGSSYTADFPFYELAHKYLLTNAIYNRSIGGLTIDDAYELLDNCVFNAKPSKIFYALGEHDIHNEASLQKYEDILFRTVNALPGSKIYVLSVPPTEGDNKIYNLSLAKICKKSGVEFINIRYDKTYPSIYKQLSLFFRSGKISFFEALNV